MKILLFILLSAISALLFSETVVLELESGDYEIWVDKDYETLKADYLFTAQAYIEESNDYTALKQAFDEYKEVTEELLAGKDVVIKEQGNLIIIKDKIIVELEKPDMIAFIPSVYYEFSASGSSGGAGIGILLWDAFFIQAQVGYPLEARIGVGWKF